MLVRAFRLSLLPISLSLLSAGCAHAAPPPSNSRSADLVQVPGRTEFDGKSLKRVGPGFWLRVEESLDLPSRYLNKVIDFYPYRGGARFSDGGCIRFVRNNPGENTPPATTLLGARLSRDPSLCTDLPPSGSANFARPCAGPALDGLVDGWSLDCERLTDGRSALIAVRNGADGDARRIRLLTVDQKIAFVGAFQIHDRIEVKTFGVRGDGKAVLSTYLWNPAATVAPAQ